MDKKKVIILYTTYIEGYQSYQSEDEFLVEENRDKKKLVNVWEEYKKKYSSIPFELDFEFWCGTNIKYIYERERHYKCFCEKEIKKIKDQINDLVTTNQIAGLIISPLLTEMEIRLGNCFQTFTELYNEFHLNVPIYYIDLPHSDRRAIGWGYLEDVEPFKRVVDDFRNNGYTEERGFVESPYVPDDFFHYQIGSEEMIRYFLEFPIKKQEEKLILERIKKEN